MEIVFTLMILVGAGGPALKADLMGKHFATIEQCAEVATGLQELEAQARQETGGRQALEYRCVPQLRSRRGLF